MYHISVGVILQKFTGRQYLLTYLFKIITTLNSEITLLLLNIPYYKNVCITKAIIILKSLGLYRTGTVRRVALDFTSVSYTHLDVYKRQVCV